MHPDGGQGYCTEYLARYGPIDEAAQWDRAVDPCAGDNPDSSGAASGPEAESDGGATAVYDRATPKHLPALVRVLLAALDAENGDAGPASADDANGSDEASKNSSGASADLP